MEIYNIYTHEPNDTGKLIDLDFGNMIVDGTYTEMFKFLSTQPKGKYIKKQLINGQKDVIIFKGRDTHKLSDLDIEYFTYGEYTIIPTYSYYESYYPHLNDCDELPLGLGYEITHHKPQIKIPYDENEVWKMKHPKGKFRVNNRNVAELLEMVSNTEIIKACLMAELERVKNGEPLSYERLMTNVKKNTSNRVSDEQIEKQLQKILNN